MVDPRCCVKKSERIFLRSFFLGPAYFRKAPGPRHQLFQKICVFIIHVRNHCFQHMFEIVVGTQSVRADCFRDTVQDPAGFRPVLCGCDLPVLFPDTELFDAPLCVVVVQRHFSILKEGPQIRFLIQAVVQRLAGVRRRIPFSVPVLSPTRNKPPPEASRVPDGSFSILPDPCLYTGYKNSCSFRCIRSSITKYVL